MLDVGERLEPDRADLKTRLANTEPERWSASDVAALTGGRRTERAGGIWPFGSDFLFRDPTRLFVNDDPPARIGLRPSFAAGGLSNGWGASVLPYRDEDLADWPQDARALAPHYAALESFMPVAARPDALTDLFPMHPIGRDTGLALTSQARVLLGRLESRREWLGGAGVHFGHARVAVSAPACCQCGMCLHGCAYGAIFNAAAVLDNLRAHPRFSYRPGHYVTRFEEAPDQVTVSTTEIGSGGRATFQGERLFVAGGVLPTARLVLASLDRVDEPLALSDSQHFFLPMLHSWWPRPNPAQEPAPTLTQLFLEILDPAVSPHTVHVQLYTYNDLYAVDMGRRFGAFSGVASPLTAHLSRRLIVAQGFLHSDSSSAMELRLVRTDGDHSLELRERRNPDTEPAVARARRKLAGVAWQAGLVALSPFGRLGSTGSSFHCGGTFPMRDRPVGLETDVLGRPAGLARVHVVDASIFPTLPATTITFSVMATAHRIATQSATLDAAP